MKYYFKDIENGSIESAAVLDFEDENGVKRSAVHNLIITIVDHEAEVPDDYTATALMFLAEQNGGELVQKLNLKTKPLPEFSMEEKEYPAIKGERREVKGNLLIEEGD